MKNEGPTYPPEILHFLRSLLDDSSINLLRTIIRHNREQKIGLGKSMLEDYTQYRKQYDRSFTQLEAQGLIAAERFGQMKLYSITERGLQLAQLLKKEKELKGDT